MRKALLEIRDLDVSFHQARGVSHSLRGIDLAIFEREVHGLVGESGSGKTVTSTAVMGLLPVPPARVNGGEILFGGRNLLTVGEAERRRLRGKEIGMIFQEPGKYLNPAFTVGEQIIETLCVHFPIDRAEAAEKALGFLELVGLGGTRRVLKSYPHELSGGMKQRAMIAMAVCCHPALLIADEPTTALDVTLQLQILRLIADLREAFSMGILFISHDLGVVREIADRVSVIYAGKIVETAPTGELFANPLHPYTRLLLLSIPDAARRGTRLHAIPGTVPDAEHVPPGCSFHPRCPLAEGVCRERVPPSAAYGDEHQAACFMIGKKWIDSVDIRSLTKTYPGPGLFGAARRGVTAVDRVSFGIDRGTIFGLVGESGCGKTSLVRALLYLDPPTAGEVWFDGTAARRPFDRGPAPFPAAHADRLPGPQQRPEPQDAHRGQPGRGLDQPRGPAAGAQTGASRRCSSWWGSRPPTAAATPTSSPAGRSSAS